MTTPTIVIIDDKEEGHGLKSLLDGDATMEIFHPRDVELDAIRDAQLVLVDYKLEDSEWPERADSHSLSLQPADGIALANLLRRHLIPFQSDPPTAFALLTSYVIDVVAPFPHDNRNHQIARFNNLEWVFEKAEKDGQQLCGQLLSLASAVESLPSDWNSSDTASILTPLLGLAPDDTLHIRFLDDVYRCRPPLHELSEWSHGLAFLRWLLHRVLPYSCFLVDQVELSRRLRITPQSFHNLSPGSDLTKALDATTYSGILAGFAGPRWWRSGVEQFLWNATDGKSTSKEILADLMKSMSGGSIEILDIAFPVSVLDENFRVSKLLVERESTVRIRPDDWPSFCEPPYTSIERALENPALASLVIEQDKTKLTIDGQESSDE